ncbi:MAG: hypothetical protein CSA81_03360 [Acidobacteria bacterium]|nr:MAG: hypothetical protein CSA81_03360 [Acidobacteriota bacterium]
MKKILIADDSPVVRQMIAFMVKKMGYQPLLAADGLEAAEITFKEGPHLVISDIEMPKMNGFQLCRLLKSDELTKDVPLAILTSKEGVTDKFWGMDTGAERYILKNSKSRETQRVIRQLMEENRAYEPRVHREISLWEIIEKVNNTFDKKLLESKLVNQIHQAIFEVHNLKEGILKLSEIYKKVLGYSLSCFYFNCDSESRMIFNLAEALTETSFREIKHAIYRLAEVEGHLIEDQVETEIEGSFGDISGTVSNEHFFVQPLSSQAVQFGFLAFYTRDPLKIPNQAKKLFKVTRQASNLVIDNLLMNEQIRLLSVIDNLTQIYNRRHFMEYFVKELDRCKRLSLKVSVILIDIDDFKQVNDVHNHLSGDLVLKDVAQLIKASIRKMDIPARYGGEEFICLLPETSVEEAILVSERIRASIETFTFYTYDKQPINITVSVGICHSADKVQLNDPLEWIKMADTRLYHAKRTGKNRVCH